MLGLVDFFKAVYGTVSLALKRVHPLAGPVLVAVVWVLALGSLLWVTRGDEDPSDGAAERAERSDQSTPASSSSSSDDDDAGRGSGEDDEGDGDGRSGSIRQADADDATSSDDGHGDGPVLEAPGGPGRVTAPSTSTGRPSIDPVEPSASTTWSTTPSTSDPSDPSGSTSTTSTTQPASGCNGGLLAALLGLLIPCP
jgi:hypothetical protein